MLVISSALATIDSHAAESEFQFRPGPLQAVDDTIAAAIARGEIPGAVLWIESHGKTHRRAYGNRALIPAREPMTDDTVFDLASLTKVIATTTVAMSLVDEGKLDLDAPVRTIVPGFGGGAKDRILVRQLLTHSGGLLWWAPLYE